MSQNKNKAFFAHIEASGITANPGSNMPAIDQAKAQEQRSQIIGASQIARSAEVQAACSAEAERWIKKQGNRAVIRI